MTAQTDRRRTLPYRLVMEPRLEQVPPWMPPLISLGAIIVALIIGAVILAIVGGNPFSAWYVAHAPARAFSAAAIHRPGIRRRRQAFRHRMASTPPR